ncbi:MAG TPA: cupin domain-containing protein [Candidatus Limnocylindrales bacterium]|nr:cupin domain-containing protein [Candidatus Limnocylindrales bacterium]
MRSIFTSRIDVEEWEPDAETGGLVHLLRADDSIQAGVWRPGPAAGRVIELVLEAEETLLVLDGRGRLEIDGERAIELRPGVALSMRKGTRTRWTVDDDFREFWVYSLTAPG